MKKRAKLEKLQHYVRTRNEESTERKGNIFGVVNGIVIKWYRRTVNSSHQKLKDAVRLGDGVVMVWTD